MLKRTATYWIVLFSLLLGACGQPAPVLPPTAPGVPAPVTSPTPIPPTPIFPAPQASGDLGISTLTISYADSADWLVDLPEEDRLDQIRDWAVQGLAALLHLDLRAINNAGFDQTPVRDSVFTGLTNATVGPGRGLYDGRGTLHVLVPVDDPYASRTIGLTLDNYRKDAGQDPDQVAIYHYQIDETNEQVLLKPELPVPASDVRTANGYIEMPVDTVEDLERFLSQTEHLSQVEVVSRSLRAGGWHWPNTPSGRITLQDVTALAKGYRRPLTMTFTLKDQARLLDQFKPTLPAGMLTQQQPDSRLEIENRQRNSDASEPGFSLDPGVVLPPQDALKLIADSGQYPALTQYVGELQSSFNKWNTALDNAERGQSASDLLRMYDALDVQEPDSASLLSNLFEQSVFLEAAIYDFPGIEPYAADLRSAFSDLANPTSSATVKDQAAETISIDADLLDFSEPRAADRIRNGLQQRPRPVYQVARYEGGLQGTDAAMTYFYTDLVAKTWSFNLGHGVPYQEVAGFIPDTLAKTPWGFCPNEPAHGRLWFGLRHEGLSIQPREVDFGEVATRVFTLIKNDSLAGEEVQEIEPEYFFGRIIWWWDRHYMAMADYEPQYHRLDQLTRWGAVLAWLTSDSTLPKLPTLPDEQVRRDWRFDEWFAQNAGDLKWQYDIPFVQPEGETTEALLRLYSIWYGDCGGQWQFSGGISAPRTTEIETLAKERPELPPAVGRAGLSEQATSFNEDTNTGILSRVVTRSPAGEPETTIKWNLKPASDSIAEVDVEASGSKAWRFGDMRSWIDSATPRQVSLEFEKQPNGYTEKLAVQKMPVGELTVTAEERRANVAFEPGAMAGIRSLVNKVQNLLLEDNTPSSALGQIEDVNLRYQEPGSDDIQVKIGDMWATIRPIDVNDVPDENLAFRIGKPGKDGAPPTYYEIGPGPAPALPGEWLTVDRNHKLQPNADPPGTRAEKYALFTFTRLSDGSRGSLYVEGGQPVISSADSGFWLEGNSDMAPFVQNPEAILTKIGEARQAAEHDPNRLARGVFVSDDTLLLVTPDEQILVDASHARFQQLRDAFKITAPDELRFKVSADHPDQILWVADFEGPIVYESPRIVVLDDFLKSNQIDISQQPIRGPPIALEPSLLEETGPTPNVIGLDAQVRIVQVELTPGMEDMISRGVDLVRINGQNWRIISRDLTNAGGGRPITPVPAHPSGHTITLICRASACPSVSPGQPGGTPTHTPKGAP